MLDNLLQFNPERRLTAEQVLGIPSTTRLVLLVVVENNNIGGHGDKKMDFQRATHVELKYSVHVLCNSSDGSSRKVCSIQNHIMTATSA